MTLFIEKYGKFNETICRWAEVVAIFATVFMVGLSSVDVISSKVFNTPVFGSIDMVMLAQWMAMTMAAAITLIKKMHIRVDFVVEMLPGRLQAILDGVVDLVCIAFFILIAWNLVKHGYSFQVGGEESATARIPLHPFMYLGALGCLLVASVYLQQFLGLIWTKHKTRLS